MRKYITITHLINSLLECYYSFKKHTLDDRGLGPKALYESQKKDQSCFYFILFVFAFVCHQYVKNYNKLIN